MDYLGLHCTSRAAIHFGNTVRQYISTTPHHNVRRCRWGRAAIHFGDSGGCVLNFVKIWVLFIFLWHFVTKVA